MALPSEETTEAPGPASAPAGRCRMADAAAFALFVTVPLAASPAFRDQFTSVKWYVLEALAAVWFLVELWRCGSGGWPAFVRRRWAWVLALGLLVLTSCLRGGVAWSGPALLDRLSFGLLVLASFWYFQRSHGWTGAVMAATGVATSLVVVVGLAQVLGWDPLPWLSAGDRRSAFFGNVNMAAQFLGFAVILLLTAPQTPARGSARGLGRAALVALTLVYLYLLSCRSVFLALGVALAVLLLTRRVTLRSLTWMLGAATLVVLLLLRSGSVLGPRSVSADRDLRPAPDKATSTAMRLAVWRGTLGLIRDHPFGVGSGSFGEAFIPYQLGLAPISTETLLFRTPHNEYLRTLAEEGIVFAVVVAGLLLSLLRDLWGALRPQRGRSAPGPLLSAGIAFLAVEAFFQFPFGTAFGSLMAALLLGLALAALEPLAPSPEPRRARASWRIGGTIVAAAVVSLLARVAVSEWLFVNRNRDVRAQEVACRYDPRNLPACVTAAWLHARSGQHREARARLVQVLWSAPYYHPAIRLLADVAAADGDRRGACLYLWVYDELFRGHSSAHSRLAASCGLAPPSDIPADVEMPYYGAIPLAEGDSGAR